MSSKDFRRKQERKASNTICTIQDKIEAEYSEGEGLPDIEQVILE